MEWLLTSLYNLLNLKTANAQPPPPAEPTIPSMCCGLLPVLGIGLFTVWLLLYLLSLRTKYSLKGKHVLITGGSSGIGKAVAKEALKRGAGVVTILARDKEKLTTVKNELERLISAKVSQKIHSISVDVSLESSKEDIQLELSGFPPVDVLVNSAGVTHSANFQDTTSEAFEKQLRVNVLGSVHPTQAVLPDMIDRKTGRIIFISSLAGQMAVYGYSAYSASKYAVRGLAEVLDMELKVHNIRVGVSFPPDTDTPMLQEEVEARSPIQAAQAKYGSVFEADKIARDICCGIERGSFLISHGFDGLLLKIITAGMSPVYHWCTAITEVFLMGVLRMVAYVYIKIFYNIVSKELKKSKKNT